MQRGEAGAGHWVEITRYLCGQIRTRKSTLGRWHWVGNGYRKIARQLELETGEKGRIKIARHLRQERDGANFLAVKIGDIYRCGNIPALSARVGNAICEPRIKQADHEAVAGGWLSLALGVMGHGWNAWKQAGLRNETEQG